MRKGTQGWHPICLHRQTVRHMHPYPFAILFTRASSRRGWQEVGMSWTNRWANGWQTTKRTNCIVQFVSTSFVPPFLEGNEGRLHICCCYGGLLPLCSPSMPMSFSQLPCLLPSLDDCDFSIRVVQLRAQSKKLASREAKRASEGRTIGRERTCIYVCFMTSQPRPPFSNLSLVFYPI